ncbi:hypothetical protein JMF89_10440 [Clostridiaceae bacterium UIB06]|uniref:Uncharacterized protein n=1 Tax=Clostridium thailandense TaxID=2794346 RepID=A0A949U215_9CLOT|nr:hypothetical protein [Clostridium thailandense]MBV7274874.1 hypothetical protein [Clostridium thailandense]MCH5137619.1 hypothetical protein [Clostridiaceae bacterium UIB06]
MIALGLILGVLLSMYGYYIEFCRNHKLLLVKIVVFTTISDIFFYLSTLIENEYFSDIYDVIYSFILIRTIRLIVREKQNIR